MYVHSRNAGNIAERAGTTRANIKYVFKLPARVTNKYKRSPFYIGCKQWDKLSKEVQDSRNMIDFKKRISRLNIDFVKDFIV